jgi:hypothetical protein
MTYAIEVKGEINILYEVKNHPLEFSGGLLALGFLIFVSTASIKIRNLKKKYNSLVKEEQVLFDLMKVVQRDTFEKGKMSMEEYGQSMMQYEKKLNNVISEKIKTQSRIAHFLSFKGKRNALTQEKFELRKLIEETQRKYLTEGSLDTRIYQNMLKTYASRLVKVDEELINSEVKSFFRKNKFSRPDFSRDEKKEEKNLKRKIKKERKIISLDRKKSFQIKKEIEKKVRKKMVRKNKK